MIRLYDSNQLFASVKRIRIKCNDFLTYMWFYDMDCFLLIKLFDLNYKLFSTITNYSVLIKMSTFVM